MLSTLALILAPLQTVTVQPGDPAALQDAIDAAPPGAVIMIEGGEYDPITIDKPLTLIGDPVFRVDVGPGMYSSLTTAVQLDG